LISSDELSRFVSEGKVSQRIKTNRPKRRRTGTYIWVAVMAAVLFMLIYEEQTALLYVLATLGVTLLLVVVAIANLEDTEKPIE
jgi:L-asparagine transporter-like permease